MKKSRTSLFRVLILSLVMLVTVFIIGIAWFATKEEATASGLSIRSSYGEGLDSSFDNANFATHIERKQLNLFKLPLITGDGTNFFIPKLDRATGTPVDQSGNLILDGKNWVSKRDVKKATFPGKDANGNLLPFTPGDYYEEDIYFRSDKELDVYLTGLSSVTPLDTAENTLNRKSDFGEFTKDNIAGAARIAFFNVTKTTSGEGESAVTTETENPIFTWVPNDKYQLTLSENMAPVERKTAGTGGSGGAIFNPVKGQEEKWWNDYIENTESKDTESKSYGATKSGHYLYYYNAVSGSNKIMKAVQMWETDTEYFGIIDIDQADVDYRIAVFDFSMNSDKFPNSLTHFTHQDIEGGQIKAAWQPQNASFPIKIANVFEYELRDTYNTKTIFTYGDNQTYDKNLWWAKLYMKRTDGAYSDYTHWQVRVSYKKGDTAADKVLAVDDVIYYKNKDYYITTPGIGSKLDRGQSGSVPYYDLEENSNIIITSSGTTEVDGVTYADALSVNANSTKSVQVEMIKKTISETKEYYSPKNPNESMLFTVIGAGTDESNFSQYKLKSVFNNMYLTIKNDQIVLEDVSVEDAAIFKVMADTSTTGPMLQCNGMYVTYSNGSFGVSNTKENAVLQIYQGSSYGFNDNGKAETSYKYYDKNSGTTKNLSDSTNVKKVVTDTLLRGSSTDDGGPQKVVTLVKPLGSQSYIAHIRIRIWAEGTDREAKMPLAGGIFKTHLEFQGVPKDTTAPTNPAA